MDTLFSIDEDFSDKRVLVSLSGGINSAAVLCYLASKYLVEKRPKKIWIYYAHLKEHSPGTLRFVRDQIRYARSHFEEVVTGFHFGSVVEFFRKEKFIAHPIVSPCSEHLKYEPLEKFSALHRIEVDLIGYVRSERRRIKRQIASGAENKFYPISHLTDADCFDLVKEEIGWYPEIYDINRNGKRVFKHNNCLPCKNFDGFLDSDGNHSGQYSDVKEYFPSYFERARELAADLDLYWGREADLIGGHCKYCEFESIEDLPLFSQEYVA